MYDKKNDFRKYKCGKEECNAPIPEIFLESVHILRREIPHLSALLNELGDAMISYRVFAPVKRDAEISELDPATVLIWVNPKKHFDPCELVQGALNIACGSFTMEEEMEYFSTLEKKSFLKKCREANCPVCSKNQNEKRNSWAMSREQYDKYPVVGYTQK